MSRLPSAVSGFFQAPDQTVNVVAPRVQGPNTIYQAARAGARPGQQVLQILDSFLGAANAGIGMRIKYNAAEEGAGAEAALQDQAGMLAAIESDDPSWDFSIWNQDPDGTASVMDSDQIRAQILERMPVPENASEAWKEGYFRRIMPGVEKQIYSRGFERRNMFVEGQLGLISEGLLSRASTYGRAEVEAGITEDEHFNDFMDEAYKDIRKLVPQVTGESDELYGDRLAKTAWEKVFKPVVPALIRSGDYTLLNRLDQNAVGSIRPEFLDMVRRGHAENIHEALKNPKITEDGEVLYQMPIHSITDQLQFDGRQIFPGEQDPTLGTEEFVIRSQDDMKRYLGQTAFTDPDSMFYISDPDRIMNEYFGASKSDDELTRTIQAMNGDSTRPYDGKYEAALEAQGFMQNGWVSRGPDAGLALARTGHMPTATGENLILQAQNNDPEVAGPAVEALVLMSQYPDQRAWMEIKRSSKDTATQIMLGEIEAYRNEINLFPAGKDGPMNAQADAVTELATRFRTRTRSAFQPDDKSGPLAMQSAGFVLNSAMFRGEYTERGVIDEVNKLATEHLTNREGPNLDTGALDFFGPDLQALPPNVQGVMANKYAEFAQVVQAGNPGTGQTRLKELTDDHFTNWLDTSTSTAVVNGNASINWLPSGFSENGKWGDSHTEERMTAMFAKNGLDWSTVHRVEPTIHPTKGSGYVAFDDYGRKIALNTGMPAFIPTEQMYFSDEAARNQSNVDAAATRTSPEQEDPFAPKPFQQRMPM